MSEADYRTPGQLIKDLLEKHGWTQQILAAVLDVDKTIVSKIIQGKRSVDAPMAIALAEVFDEAPETFLDLQQSFDLAQAKIITRPDPKRAARARLFSALPVSKMMQRGWIKESRLNDVDAIETSLVEFFEAKSLDEVEVLPHAAKKTNVADSVTPLQLIWLYRVRQIAREMLAPRFTKNKAEAALKKLKELLHSPEEARHVPRILAEAGIRYVLVEGFKSGKIDGVCFWLDDHSPVIGMSLRYDRIDNFWFVLRHELEHVLRGDGKTVISVDANLEGANGGVGEDLPECERLANMAGAEFCVAQKTLGQFIRRKAPMFAERDVIGLSKMQHVHPGLVAGQLQRHSGRYELFRKFLVPIRKHVAPSAMVDGWGDIPPLG